MFFSKSSPDRSNVVFVVASVDPYHVQAGHVHIPLSDFGLDSRDTYQVHDLLTGAFPVARRGELRFAES